MVGEMEACVCRDDNQSWQTQACFPARGGESIGMYLAPKALLIWLWGDAAGKVVFQKPALKA
jgi:hypothetical protein